MKKNKLILFAFTFVLILSSCGINNFYKKETRYLPIYFAPFDRKDYKLVGNLETEATITGKMTPKGKMVDKKFIVDYKKGVGSGENITGTLYGSTIFVNIYNTDNSLNTAQKGFLGKLKALGKRIKIEADPAKDFAYYELAMKYPHVDYFINVRFDRHISYTKKGFTEKVTVKADGVQLITD